MGGLTYGEVYNGYGVQYDYKSMYASIMRAPSFQFPIKEGEWLTLNDEELSKLDYYKFGCYHCTIEKKMRKLFKYNWLNWYTHHDLTNAKLLGLKIEMICDGQANFLYYSKDKLISGFNVFKDYIDFLLDLKKRTQFAKPFYLNLWGSLCMKNKRVYYHNYAKNNENFKIKDGCSLIDYTEHNGLYKINVENHNKIFVNNFARMSCFITSYARYLMAKRMKDIEHVVIQIQTDGFTVSDDVVIKTTDKVSEVIEKRRGYCSIKNCNSISFK
jgi:hypothetical protein